MTRLLPSPAILETPLEFAPWLRPQVWGGRQLRDRLHKPLPPTGRFGESWELSTLEPHISEVVDGAAAGCTLPEVWAAMQADLPLSFSSRPFPWLVKWLDCREYLSVQVHPDAETSQRWLGHVCPKSEVWVVVEAGPSSVIYAGLAPGVTPSDFERRLGHSTLVQCLHPIRPQVGDCLYLPAGTIHAAGDGLLLAEIQQPSDATFRIFDWHRRTPDGKPRDLHWLEALDSISWPQPPVEPQRPSPWPSTTPGLRGEHLVTAPDFRLDRLTITAEAVVEAPPASVWMVLSGSGEMHWSHGERSVQPGLTLLLPPRLRQVTWSPDDDVPLVLLRVTSPQL